MLEFISFPGLVIGTIVVAAAAWSLGLREPFVLTAFALLVGGGGGVLFERYVVRKLRKRT